MQQLSKILTSHEKPRKPQKRTVAFREAILAVADEYDRMSVRQLFYQLVDRRIIEKTENQCKRVSAHTVAMRKEGTLPYSKIVDGSRIRRNFEGFGSLGELFEAVGEQYRQNAWVDQPIAVEVWCEKDALSGIIEPICREYGVTYVAARGFSSVTLQYETAMAIAERGKPTYIYYFGDHDPSGRCMSDKLEHQLRAHGAEVYVRRVALEPEHMLRYRLPTRPTKKSDSRRRKFVEEYGDAIVELDALPPNILSRLVRACIVQHIDEWAFQQAKLEEAAARETLANFAKTGWVPGRVYRLNNT